MTLKLTIFWIAIVLWIWFIFRWANRKLAKNMLFFPVRKLENSPSKHNLKFEDVYFETQDRKTLHGWFIPSDNAIATVYFLHGNAGNISHRLDEIALWHCIKVSVFIIDYRGYGNSKGSPDESGLYIDAEAGYDYLIHEKKIPPQQIICFGRSLGGAVAIRLALSRELGGLILSSTFTTIRDVIKKLFPGFLSWLFCWTCPFKLKSKELIAFVTAPILIIHGNRDELIPFDMAKELYELAPNPKILYPVNGGDHNNTFLAGGKQYWYVIENFIKKSVTELHKKK